MHGRPCPLGRDGSAPRRHRGRRGSARRGCGTGLLLLLFLCVCVGGGAGEGADGPILLHRERMRFLGLPLHKDPGMSIIHDLVRRGAPSPSHVGHAMPRPRFSVVAGVSGASMVVRIGVVHLRSEPDVAGTRT